MGVHKLTSESLEEFLYRQRGLAKQVLVKNDMVLSQLARRKQWRYFGHCIRNNRIPLLRTLMLYRDHEWWQQQKGLSVSKVRHRYSGAQLQHMCEVVEKFLGAREFNLLAAEDRDLWKELEKAYLTE
eukprot:6323494-Karenia_brevis.AAC.1